jgi:predicted PurR-regulated permease PerM
MVRLAAFGVVLVVLHLGRPIVIPMLLAVLIAISLSRIVDLAGRWLPRWLAALTSVLVAVAVVSGLGWLVARAATEFARGFPEFRDHWLRLQAELAAWLWGHDLGIPATAVEQFQPHEMARDLALPGLTLALSIVSTGLLVLVITVFFVIESASMSSKLENRSRLGRIDIDLIRRAAGDVQQYLWIKTVTSTITGLLVGLLTAAFGLEHSLLFGMLAFALNFIPNVGSILASIPAIGLCLMEFGWPAAMGLGAGYLLINFVVGLGLEPRWAGRATDLSPTVVVLSMIFWGFVLGPMGALLSVPLTIIVRIVSSQSDEWSWLALLLRSTRGALRSHDSPVDPQADPVWSEERSSL